MYCNKHTRTLNLPLSSLHTLYLYTKHIYIYIYIIRIPSIPIQIQRSTGRVYQYVTGNIPRMPGVNIGVQLFKSGYVNNFNPMIQ